MLALTCIATTFLEVTPRVDNDFFIVIFAFLFVVLNHELVQACALHSAEVAALGGLEPIAAAVITRTQELIAVVIVSLVLVAQVEIVGGEFVLVEVQVLGSLAVVRW